MRLGGDGPSGNFEDRTGQGGGFGLGGGGGGGMLGCLLPLVMSRFGLIGVVILLLGYCALQSLGAAAAANTWRRRRRANHAIGALGSVDARA